MVYDSSSVPAQLLKLAVVGVGGAGCAVLNQVLVVQAARAVEATALGTLSCIAVDTDDETLQQSLAPVKIRIGRTRTKGCGMGRHPTAGHDAAWASFEELRDALRAADLVFITAGMGGVTGTGAAPAIAQIAWGLRALTVGVVTKPFPFESDYRKHIAEGGIAAFKEKASCVMCAPNIFLVPLADEALTKSLTFALAVDVLCQGILGLVDAMLIPSPINLGIAEMRNVIYAAGAAVLAVGRASGADRAVAAARQAIANPLWNVSIKGAESLLLILTSNDHRLFEVNGAAAIIQEAAGTAAEITFGVVFDPTMGDDLQVTIIATSFASRPPFRPGEGSACPAIPPHGSPRHDAVELPLPEPERPLADAIGQWLREQRHTEPT